MEIILTFTYKTSLKVWEDTGLLTREMLFYKKLADKYQINFTFITYGDNYDLRFENYFQNQSFNEVKDKKNIYYKNKNDSKIISKFLKNGWNTQIKDFLFYSRHEKL